LVQFGYVGSIHDVSFNGGRGRILLEFGYLMHMPDMTRKLTSTDSMHTAIIYAHSQHKRIYVCMRTNFVGVWILDAHARHDEKTYQHRQHAHCHYLCTCPGTNVSMYVSIIYASPRSHNDTKNAKRD